MNPASASISTSASVPASTPTSLLPPHPPPAPPPPSSAKSHQDQPSQAASSSSSTRFSTGKYRLRARQACEPCRKRKRKCDGIYPCDQCTGYEYRCHYSTQGASSDGAASHHIHAPPTEDVGASGGSPKVSKRERDNSNSSSNNNNMSVSRPEIRQCQSQSSISPPSLSALTQSGSPCANPISRAGRAVVEPRKGRFSYAHSGVVLPRKLGQEMNLSHELKFHSYGWNLSTRAEPQKFVSPTVRRFATFQEVSFYGRLYFDIVDPVYHFVDRSRFFDRCAKYWLAEKPELDDIEVLISGIVALGSYFAINPSPHEAQLVEHAKQILDLGCAYAPARLSMDQAAGWVLRTLYLRLTTRPHLSWSASCAAVHIVEAMGLHVDLEAVDLAGDEPTATLSADFLSSRRNIFECANFLNAMISAEYGRSRIPLPGLDLSLDHDENPGSNPALWKLTKLLILTGMDPDEGRRRDILASISDLPDEPPLFVLLKTDVAIHLYRTQVNVNQKHGKPSNLEIQAMLSIIRTSLSAVRSLLTSKQPWWNLISTPFQSAMILMAMDSGDSLEMVSDCMSALTAIYETFKTPSVLEVIQTARCLAEGLERRKLHQAGIMRKAAELSNGFADASSIEQGPLITAQEQAFFDVWTEGDNNWNYMAEGDIMGISAFGNMSNFP